MKWRILSFLIVFAVLFVGDVGGGGIASAQTIPDADYAIAAYVGMDVNQVVSLHRQWDDLQGRVQQLDTPAKWQRAYAPNTNRLANLLGAPNMLIEDEAATGKLSFAGRIWCAIGKYQAGQF